MKKTVILLAILVAGLAFALYRASQSAGTVAQQAQTQFGTSSNRIAELEMKLNHQEQLARSLGSQVTNRVEELSQRVAEIVHLRATLARSESEIRETKAGLAATVPVRQHLEDEIAGFKSRIGELESSLAESATKARAAVEQFAALSAQRNALALQLAHARQEGDSLRAKLGDPALLRAHLAALNNRPSVTNQTQKAVSPRSKQAAQLATAPCPESFSPLELTPDGTVQSTGPAR